MPAALGKLPPEELERLVLRFRGRERREVVLGAGVGEDAAALDLDGDLCVLAADPITGASQGMGRLAVHVAVNDVAATGAEPVAILVTLLVPAETTNDSIAALMGEIHDTALALDVAIAGGHTERSKAVTQPLISLVAAGRAPRDGLLSSSALLPGDRLLLTKGAAVEGTAILAHDFAEALEGQIAEEMLQAARAMADDISVVPDAAAARRGGARALHDVTEGGVLGALWELAQASSCTLEVDVAAVPIAPGTTAVCRALDVDPLKLIGSGALLIGAPSQSVEAIKQALAAAGISAAEIGRAVDQGPAPAGREKGRQQTSDVVRVLGGGDNQVTVLREPPTDELWRLLEG